MKVLFIGGTGTISSACTTLAANRGIDLYLLNRGETTMRGKLPKGVKQFIADFRKPDSIVDALRGHQYVRKEPHL